VQRKEKEVKGWNLIGMNEVRKAEEENDGGKRNGQRED